MLFRNAKGELIEINRYDYKTDKLYFKKIMELKSSLSRQHISNNKDNQQS
jgi:hypothetical protein